MSLSDREYMRAHRMDPEPGREPPKRTIWILVVAIILIAVFLLSYWPY